ncbi:unnamed protein product [Symbiodinium microadriaticum]|nr:unnamed protein product [Symbiodinium microadriaticum]
MPASNSDGLLANRAFLRAVDAARAQAAQQKAEEAATRLPGGVKQQAPLCLSQLSTEKLYEGKIVIAFKLGLLVDINADVLGLLRWKNVKGVPRKLLKEGGNLANLRVEKAQRRLMWALEDFFWPGRPMPRHPKKPCSIVARVYFWGLRAKHARGLRRSSPSDSCEDGEGLAIGEPAPF